MIEARAIYVIGGDDGPLKVGLARSPAARLGRLQTGHPQKLRLHHVQEVAADLAPFVEAKAHEALEKLRSHGEWFNVSTTEAVSAIEAAVLAVERGERPKRVAVGRKSKNLTDKMPGRFPDGTFDRIAAVLRPKETRTDFVQTAVEAELERRERSKPKP
ncbi:YlcI/YnfO family protein [Caulobacter segnis]